MNINWIPMFEYSVRGRLGTLLPLSINVGIFTTFIFDFFLSYSEMVGVTFAVLFVFLCTFAFFPDTPRQLYKIDEKRVIFQYATDLEQSCCTRNRSIKIVFALFFFSFYRKPSNLFNSIEDQSINPTAAIEVK